MSLLTSAATFKTGSQAGALILSAMEELQVLEICAEQNVRLTFSLFPTDDTESMTNLGQLFSGDIDQQLTKGTTKLKRFRDEFVVERHRLAEEWVRYEQGNKWGDWVIFAILLLAMVAIGIFIGWKWH